MTENICSLKVLLSYVSKVGVFCGVVKLFLLLIWTHSSVHSGELAGREVWALEEKIDSLMFKLQVVAPINPQGQLSLGKHYDARLYLRELEVLKERLWVPYCLFESARR